MRRGKCGIVLALAVAFLVLPSMAFGDVQTSYPGATGSGSAANMTAAWAAVGGSLLGATVDEYKADKADNTYNDGTGILDAVEFLLLDEVLKNENAPHHTEIHEAFKANRALAYVALGEAVKGSVNIMIPQLVNIMAGYLTFGEWDFYYVTIASLKKEKLGCTIPAGPEGCVLGAGKYLGAYGDLDGDGVKNGEEYAANAGAFPVSAVTATTTASAAFGSLPEASWQNVINDDKIKVCGATPYLTRFFYNPETDKLYLGMPGLNVIKGARIDADRIVINEVAMPAHVLSVRSQAEQDFLYAALLPVYSYQEENTSTHVMETKGEIMLGLCDVATEGSFVWDNGDPIGWTGAWNTGEPNNSGGDEDYGYMRMSDGKWNDDDEWRTDNFVLEFDGTFADANADGVPDTLAALFVTLPTAAFTATPAEVDMGDTVTFHDDSVPNGPAISSWLWDFGDGTTSTQQHPTHVYMADDPSSTYTVTLTVTNANGSRTLVKTNYITVNYVCAFEGQLTAQGMYLASALMADDTIGPKLTDYGYTSWDKWDIEGLGTDPGDGLPDALQMILIERTACNSGLPHSADVYAAMTANKATFLLDVAALAELDPDDARYAAFADLFAGFFGLSPEMRATVLALLDNPVLPHMAEYVYFAPTAKSVAPWFAGSGDLDGDGVTNADEYTEVAAAYAPITSENYDAFVEAFVEAATSSSPFWDGNPNLPVAGVLGLGLLAGSLLMGAGAALRRK